MSTILQRYVHTRAHVQHSTAVYVGGNMVLLILLDRVSTRYTENVINSQPMGGRPDGGRLTSETRVQRARWLQWCF